MLTERDETLGAKHRPWSHHPVFLFVLGMILPPLAVAVRFGIGRDFWINVVLTLCGYVPGYAHFFYIQCFRNNGDDRGTPKWTRNHGRQKQVEQQRMQNADGPDSPTQHPPPVTLLPSAPYVPSYSPTHPPYSSPVRNDGSYTGAPEL